MADKTFSEMMHEKIAENIAKRAQEREQQRNEFLNGFRSELDGYQQKAQETAKKREIDNLRTLFASGLLDEEQKEKIQEKILNSSLITVTDADYGANLPRVKELLDFIANPEKAQKKIDQESFIAMMKGFSERNAKN